MHIPTHILSGWCAANLLPLNPRQRAFCMIAASVADLDGLGRLVSEEVYWDWHHVLNHNVFFGLLVAAALTTFPQPRRALAFVSYLALFHLHLLLDLYGSGPGWGIHCFWPISSLKLQTSRAWHLYSWQNITAAYALLGWTIWIAYRYRRTPLEAIMPKLDAQLVALLPGRRDCQPAARV